MTKSIHIPVGDSDNADRSFSGLLPGAGLIVAVAAFAGASCCVLPLLLAAAGVGGAWIAQLAIFVSYQWYILGFAVALIAISWVVALVRGSTNRAKIILAISTALVVAAVIVPIYEDDITRHLLRILRG